MALSEAERDALQEKVRQLEAERDSLREDNYRLRGAEMVANGERHQIRQILNKGPGAGSLPNMVRKAINFEQRRVKHFTMATFRLQAALKVAVNAIRGLAEQQAMPDDSYLPALRMAEDAIHDVGESDGSDQASIDATHDALLDVRDLLEVVRGNPQQGGAPPKTRAMAGKMIARIDALLVGKGPG